MNRYRALRRVAALSGALVALVAAAQGSAATVRPALPTVIGPHETEDPAPVFRFRSRGAARFACAFDSTRLRRCAARYSKRLTPGRHVLRVQAVGATGLRSRVRTHVVVVATPLLLFSFPGQIVAESTGSLLVAETGGRIVRVNPAAGTTSVVTPVTSPFGLAISPSGTVYFSDDNALRRLDPGGAISTVATFSSDVGPLAVIRSGDVYATTSGRIYRLPGGNVPAEPYVGTDVPGDGGDGGPALEARISAPHGLAVAPDGALLISDTGNGRLRRVEPSSHVIRTIATIEAPYGVAVGPDGLVYLSSVTSDRVLRLDASGSVTPFVTGLRSPSSIAFDSAGVLYVTEGNSPLARIWRVGRDGTAAPLRGRASR